MPSRIRVEHGEVAVSNDPGDVLEARDLAACVAICMFDPIANVGGLAHVVLPSSTIQDGPTRPAVFADRAVPLLIEAMTEKGAQPTHLKVTMAGGAEFIGATADDPVGGLGRRTVDAIDGLLRARRIDVTQRSVGGLGSRCVELRLGEGRVVVDPE